MQEAPVNAKPVRWTDDRAAYLRQYDGDYRMSLQEEQQLLIRHQRPREDTAPVPGTSIDSLDDNLVRVFLRNVRAGSTSLREQPDKEILLNLYDICTFAADTEERRVIEGLGTGIRAVRDVLREADMEPVRFYDTGVQFTALLPRSALLSPADLSWLSALDSTGLSVEQRHALESGARSRAQIAEATGLTRRQVGYALNQLNAAGLISVQGGQGSRTTTYQRV